MHLPHLSTVSDDYTVAHAGGYSRFVFITLIGKEEVADLVQKLLCMNRFQPHGMQRYYPLTNGKFTVRMGNMIQ